MKITIKLIKNRQSRLCLQTQHCYA